MIVFVKADGSVQSVLPSPVYQGSSLEGSLYFVAPFPETNAVDVAFVRANGDVIGKYGLTRVTSGLPDVLDKLGTEYNVWEWQASNADVTAYAGEVTMQFRVIYAGQTLATASTVFTVQEGVIPQPVEPSADQWDTLIELYSRLNAKVPDAFLTDIAISEPDEDNIVTVTKYYNNGTTATEEFPAGGTSFSVKSEWVKVIEFFTTSAWVNASSGSGYEIAFSPSQTGYSDNKFLTSLESTETGGYSTLADTVFKGSDGSVLISATEKYSGRLITLGGGIWGGVNVTAGSGEDSVQQVGSALAFGEASAAFGENTKEYQKAGFVAGSNSITGMTEEEFDAWYWDSTNNKPLHSGHGKIGGKITNELGENYAESTSFGATFGQDNRGFERNTLTHGDSNDNRSECGLASGNGNYQEGLADRVSGQFNKLNARNSQADGYRNYVGYEVSDDGKTITPLEFETIRDSSAAGTRNVVSHTGSHLKGVGLKTGRKHQVAVGEANAGKADTLFEVGHGTYNEVSEEVTSRANALEVTEKNSLAVGGKRYDKLTDPNRTPTSADGNQAFAAGGSAHAHGDFSAAIGKDVNSYQKCAIAAGGGCEAGLTEAEFNALYPNGVNEDGETYEKSYSLGVAMGENAKSKGRAAVAAGSNVKADRYGAAFGSYNQAGKRALVGGDNNDSTGENTFTAGRGNKNTQQFANVMGTGNESTAPHQTIVGSYAEKNQYKRFQVGVGQSDNNREDAFSVWTDGRASVSGAPQESHDVVRKQELDSLAGNGLQRTTDGKLQVKAGANLSFGADGSLNAVGSQGSEYANTSEIIDNAITLTSTSTLADLATQILAQKTKVVSIPYGDVSRDANIMRILGSPSDYATSPYDRIQFKVFSTSGDLSPTSGAYAIIDVVYMGSGEYKVSGQIILLDEYQWIWSGWNTETYPVGSIYLTTANRDPAGLFGGTWEQIGKTGIPVTEKLFGIAASVQQGQSVDIYRMSIPANTSAFIFGHISANVSDANNIMGCMVSVLKATDSSLVNDYAFSNRTTMHSGGGTSLSIYFPAVNYDCYAVLNTYGYRQGTTPLVADLQVTKIPQNQYVWKRIG